MIIDIVEERTRDAVTKTTWEELNANFEKKFGRYKKLDTVPTDEDINLVVQFVADTTDEEEKFLGGLWIQKFYSHRDKYGQRSSEQRIRKMPLKKPTSTEDQSDDDNDTLMLSKEKPKKRMLTPMIESEEDDDELILTQKSRKKAKSLIIEISDSSRGPSPITTLPSKEKTRQAMKKPITAVSTPSDFNEETIKRWRTHFELAIDEEYSFDPNSNEQNR